jgi:hypothetical protein
MTFDDVIALLRSWIGEEVYISIEDYANNAQPLHAKGVLHAPDEMRGASEARPGGYAFEVGDARQVDLELERHAFRRARGSQNDVEVWSGSTIIRIGTDAVLDPGGPGGSDAAARSGEAGPQERQHRNSPAGWS